MLRSAAEPSVHSMLAPGLQADAQRSQMMMKLKESRLARLQAGGGEGGLRGPHLGCTCCLHRLACLRWPRPALANSGND